MDIALSAMSYNTETSDVSSAELASTCITLSQSSTALQQVLSPPLLLKSLAYGSPGGASASLCL